MSGDDVNLLKFPVPLIHELDGGRFIGTACLVITRDPDEGWVNFGAYRGMVQDEKSMSCYISPGKHGTIQRSKYFEKGKPCPVIISVGQDPVLFMVSGNEIDYGVSEFDYAGGLKGSPIEVIEGKATGLPFPAHAEIVIEGFMDPNDRKTEGPFGEWTGYYASSSRPEPVVRVQNIYYRNDPILTCARPGRPPSDYSIAKCMVKSALIWEQVEKCGVPDVKGVWCHEAGGGRLFNIISIKQRYPAMRDRRCWPPRKSMPAPISAAMSSSSTRISIRPIRSTLSGHWRAARIPSSPLRFCAAAGAARSIREFSRARRASTPALSSMPAVRSSG